MKKTVVLCVISLGVLGGFVSAKEPERNFLNNQLFLQQQISTQTIKSPSKSVFLEERKENNTVQKQKRSQAIQKQIKKPVCITGQQLLVKDALSSKAQEASAKVSSLVQLVAKFDYSTEKIESLAKDLQILASQIAKDCSPSDFKKHRDQIKVRLDILKKEITLLKQYLVKMNHR